MSSSQGKCFVQHQSQIFVKFEKLRKVVFQSSLEF